MSRAFAIGVSLTWASAGHGALANSRFTKKARKSCCRPPTKPRGKLIGNKRARSPISTGAEPIAFGCPKSAEHERDAPYQSLSKIWLTEKVG